jgi:hypothetical protein
MIGKGSSRSRLLGALEASIKAAAHPIEAQCLRAERAALLARQGQLERARGVIDELQSQLAWQPNNTMLRAWLSLAEGLHSYYDVIGLAGRESVELAYALAQECPGAPGQRLRATTAAWLANMAFAYDEFPRMAALVREALDTAAPGHRGARARATLVAGFAYHYAGRDEAAQHWYEASRRHAIAEGDEAHLSALMHNQAWMRASQVRLAVLFDTPGDDKALAHALMSAESIGHYDAGIGTASLGSLVPMLRAQVLTAQGRWSEAGALFDTHFDAAMSEGLKRIAPCLLADRAWCDWHDGRPDRARAHTGAAEQALADPIDIDDRAMALARLAQVHDALGAGGVAAQHREESRRLVAAHREQQQRLAALLDEALAGLDPKDA